MAKVVRETLSSNYFPLERGPKEIKADVIMKRKTPAELRGEQLKRRPRRLESLDHPLPGSNGAAVEDAHDFKMPKTMKYIATRVDEVFPVKKSSDMFKLLSGKGKAKDNISSLGQIDTRAASAIVNGGSASKPKESCEQSEVPGRPIDDTRHIFPKIESCSQNTFRSVAELSVGHDALSGPAIINLDKALKGLGARELPSISELPPDSCRKVYDPSSISPGSFQSEIHIPGNVSLIDFTLKTTLRLVLPASVSWCHRLVSSGAFISESQLASHYGVAPHSHVCSSSRSTSEVLFSNALQTWAYPESSLPASVISAMTLSAARGETDFLLKRQLAWEDSFRSLYYLLRKKLCDIFYFCTSQFVVMFIGSELLGKSRHSCNAYLSQSTGGLRSLLRDHDICFSMPLFHSELEQSTAEDLDELLEIEKQKLGQARRSDSTSDVDNSSKSLLAFMGSEAVHGLYDFLINYRSFFSSLSGADVPVLYSPVPFQNASLCIPEVRCKEVKRADAVSSFGRFSVGDGAFEDSSSVCCSIEIKAANLPPWTTSGVCSALSSDGKSYEASFVSNPISDGLNVALDAFLHESESSTDCNNGFPNSGSAFRITKAAANPCLRSAKLSRLKYSDGSFVANLSLI